MTDTRGAEDCLYLNVWVPQGRKGSLLHPQPHGKTHFHYNTQQRTRYLTLNPTPTPWADYETMGAWT